VKFTKKLEKENYDLFKYICEEISSSNQLESYLQYLWLKNRLMIMT
jgi:hypothetical protein